MGKKNGEKAVNDASKTMGQKKKKKEVQKTPTLHHNGENKEDDYDIEILEVWSRIVDAPKTKKRKITDSTEIKKEDSESIGRPLEALTQELEIAFKNLSISRESRDKAENELVDKVVELSKLEGTIFEKENEHAEEMEKAMKRIAELEEGQNQWIDKYQTEVRKSSENEKKAIEAAKETKKLKTELKKTQSALAQREKDFDQLEKRQFDLKKAMMDPMWEMMKEALKETVGEGGRFVVENQQLTEQLEELKLMNTALSTTSSAKLREKLVAAKKRIKVMAAKKRIKELEDTIQTMKGKTKEETVKAKNQVQTAPIYTPSTNRSYDCAHKERRKNTRLKNDKYHWRNPVSSEGTKNTRVKNDTFHWRARSPSSAATLSHHNNANKEGRSTQHTSTDFSGDSVAFGPVLPPHM